MPTPCYISIEGQTQGLITAGACTADSIGDSFVEGHEDEMLVQQFDHVVTVPTDPQSGQPSGQRVHKPFKFTVALNKAVPLLYNALSSNFFTTKLENASIVDIHCEMPHCQDPAKSDFTQNVTVSLSYRKITWDHVNAGTSGSDDWRKPIEA
ncbi:Hcp family type VI secretion system effector [Vibrio cholerae]|uniref:Hcp family type VI secretion system effector n=1 Tax=Vibrio cholerae TaxID=666 RepID=UPI000663087C|nr:Hcp family type VI secretion system effector [Vibrio cholerae]CSA83599.1 Hemolysin co-regulated protein [Vibrio cholerae]CSB48490.1 Hemolysin co-regulated protein [Vibrio cholerae]CSC77668.1 Hemolysin co-regulated protein [Vibrio cholerae]CSD06675.1 Hemolysin co-regulated protein [Vibrio cholerae]CSD56890.1 Hemolysin co-regulated protein [Vibrio cholerae]